MTRKFLGIGNNYPKTDMTLKGCAPDALNTVKYITTRKDPFLPNQCRLIFNERCTTQNIKDNLYWLFDVPPNSEVVLYNSGHGSTSEQKSPYPEKDGKFEFLVTYDLDWTVEKMVTDYFLYDLMKDLDPTIRIWVGLDTCHSGGFKSLVQGRKKSITPPDDIAWNLVGRKAIPLPALNIQFASACAENELAADAQDEKGNPCGAWTNQLLKTLYTKKPEMSHKDVILSTVAGCKVYGQTPQYKECARSLEPSIL